MKHIFKALNSVLRQQKASLERQRETIRSQSDHIEKLRDEVESLEKKISQQHASMYRIHEKVKLASAQWKELPKFGDEDLYKWLDHLEYIAERRPEDQ